MNLKQIVEAIKVPTANYKKYPLFVEKGRVHRV
jgi:hypothetical protein